MIRAQGETPTGEAAKRKEEMDVAQRVVQGLGGGSGLLGKAATMSAEELTRLCLEAIRS